MPYKSIIQKKLLDKLPLCVIPLVTQFKSQATSDEYHDYFQINSNIKIVSDKFDLNLTLVRIS